MFKVNVTRSKHKAMNTCGGVELQLRLFFILLLHGGECQFKILIVLSPDEGLASKSLWTQ
jgi:hypothetical protein